MLLLSQLPLHACDKRSQRQSHLEGAASPRELACAFSFTKGHGPAERLERLGHDSPELQDPQSDLQSDMQADLLTPVIDAAATQHVRFFKPPFPPGSLC